MSPDKKKLVNVFYCVFVRYAKIPLTQVLYFYDDHILNYLLVMPVITSLEESCELFEGS
jgi:hypothetical protein